MRKTWIIDKRKKLFEQQNGLCHWCQAPMVLLDPYPTNGKIKPDVATIDHLYSTLDPLRPKKHCPTVAACADCNFRRGREYVSANKEAHRAKSMMNMRKHPPRGVIITKYLGRHDSEIRNTIVNHP